MDVDETLFEEIQAHLDITWELTSDEKSRLSCMIARGMTSLQGKIGVCNFENETQEKSLLFDYVRYDRAGALSDFWTNYKGEITSLRIRNKVKEYAEENTDV